MVVSSLPFPELDDSEMVEWASISRRVAPWMVLTWACLGCLDDDAEFLVVNLPCLMPMNEYLWVLNQPCLMPMVDRFVVLLHLRPSEPVGV
jgi:hypothetical protein